MLGCYSQTFWTLQLLPEKIAKCVVPVAPGDLVISQRMTGRNDFRELSRCCWDVLRAWRQTAH